MLRFFGRSIGGYLVSNLGGNAGGNTGGNLGGNLGGNAGGNTGGNLGGNPDIENEVISSISKNDKASSSAIANQLGLGKRTVERTLAELKSKGIIERSGGTRGKWVVKNKV